MIGAAVWQGWAWAVQWGRGAAWDGWNLKSIFSAGKQGESGEVIVYQAQAEGQKALEEEELKEALPHLCHPSPRTCNHLQNGGEGLHLEDKLHPPEQQQLCPTSKMQQGAGDGRGTLSSGGKK